MHLNFAGRPVSCPLCGGGDFTARYFSGGGGGAILRRKTNLFTRPTRSKQLAQFYACESCSWTAIFAGDTAGTPNPAE